MKTVMKKLLSIALVAILLVSAVPFQASAASSVTVPFTVCVDGNPVATKSITVNQGTDINLDEALAKANVVDWTNRKYVKWTHSEGENGILNYEWLSEDNRATTCNLTLQLASICKHNYQKKETASTCKDAGSIVYTCNECGDVKTEPLPLADHTWGDWSETVKATPTTAGKKVRTCGVCGATQEEAIPATGATTYTVSFVSDGVTVKTVTMEKDEVFGTLPEPTKKTCYDFAGWFTGINGTGTKLLSTSKWDGETFTYYAKWVENPDGTKDGLSYLTIRMRTYTGSTQTNDVLLDKVELDDDTNILQWLNNNEERVSNAIFSKVDSTKYEWLDRVYYNNDTKAELTSQATLADGDKTVFVKVHAVASTETNVQLYIHNYDSKNKTYNTLKIVDVGGYKEGDTITLTKMASVVKKYYSYTSIKGLYTDTTWKQMLGGQNPTASSSITVSSNGTVKYHVLLNGASAASSSTADKTNPTTGDMILVPVMVMVASAAAAAFVYMNSKKRAH